MKLLQNHVTHYCLLPLLFLSAPLHAADQFLLTQKTIHAQEGGDSVQQVLLTQFNQISFMPPGDWSLNSDAAKKSITLLSKDQQKRITIEFVGQNAALQPTMNLEMLRTQALARYSGLKPVIMQEFACYTDGGVGQAFDLKLKSGNVNMSVRLAYVPYGNGTVEFVLQAPTGDFSAQHNTFSDLLNSFHIGPLTKKLARP